MQKSDKFNIGINKITGNSATMSPDQESQYLSSCDNWLLVHTTKYMPLTNESGQKYIPTTAMATDFNIPRGTVHFTLNHIVENHGFNLWDEAQTVILCPFNAATKINGHPAEVSGADTYFMPQVTTGMILPDTTRIVRPATSIPENKFFEIRGNETLYKQTDFTESEIKHLVPTLGYYELKTYQKYQSGKFEEFEIEHIVNSLGKTGQQLYAAARDKTAFLRGVFADACNEILGRAVRQMATDATAKSMGYELAHNIISSAKTIANTANANGMDGNASDKGHSNSIYAIPERFYKTHDKVLTDLQTNSDNLDKLFDYINSECNDSAALDPYLDSILTETDINFLEKTTSAINSEKRHQKITENMMTLIQLWSDRANQEIAKIRTDLKSHPDYSAFIQRLRMMPRYSERLYMRHSQHNEH